MLPAQSVGMVFCIQWPKTTSMALGKRSRTTIGPRSTSSMPTDTSVTLILERAHMAKQILPFNLSSQSLACSQMRSLFGLQMRESRALVLRRHTWELVAGLHSRTVLHSPHAVVHYELPAELRLHTYALAGDWQVVEGERQVLRSPEGELRMRFVGDEVNLVMGMVSGDSSARVDVEVDGTTVQTFTIDRHDLFALWAGEYGEHEIALRIEGEGAEAYAFTFGS